MSAAATTFTWRAARDGRVFVSWQGRVVVTLSGAAARTLLARLESATPEQQQLALARATGNFKRGNERR